MSSDPISRRWRDQASGESEWGRPADSLEATAGELFRAVAAPRPRGPQAAARLLAELRARARPATSAWLRQVLSVRKLAAVLSLFVSLNFAMAFTLPPVQKWWSRVLQLPVAPTRAASAPRRPARDAPEIAAPDAPPASVGLPAAEAPENQLSPSGPSPIAIPNPMRAAAATRARPRPPAPLPVVPSLPAAATVVASESGSQSLAGESGLLSQALAALGAGQPEQALSILTTYRGRFPQGSLAYEAALAEVKAQMATGQDARALVALERAMAMQGFGDLPRSPDLVLLRAELWARTHDCAKALDTFDRLVSPPDSDDLAPALLERALYGRASCVVKRGDRGASRRALRAYLARFPNGRFARTAHAALEQVE